MLLIMCNAVMGGGGGGDGDLFCNIVCKLMEVMVVVGDFEGDSNAPDNVVGDFIVLACCEDWDAVGGGGGGDDDDGCGYGVLILVASFV